MDSSRGWERDSLTSDMNATATIRNRSGGQLPLKCGSSRSFPKKPECLRGGGNAVSHSESAVVARWKDVTGPKRFCKLRFRDSGHKTKIVVSDDSGQ